MEEDKYVSSANAELFSTDVMKWSTFFTHFDITLEKFS